MFISLEFYFFSICMSVSALLQWQTDVFLIGPTQTHNRSDESTNFLAKQQYEKFNIFAEFGLPYFTIATTYDPKLPLNKLF